MVVVLFISPLAEIDIVHTTYYLINLTDSKISLHGNSKGGNHLKIWDIDNFIGLAYKTEYPSHNIYFKIVY